jgi:hypothetical protein
VSAFVLLPASPARADLHITPFAGIQFGGNTNILDLEDAAGEKKITYGGTFAVLGEHPLGVEAEFTFTPRFFERDGQLVTHSNVSTLVGNVILAVPARWTGLSPRPFVSGGVGMMRASLADVLDEFTYSDTMLAMNVGGGFVGFFDQRKGLRVEMRYFRSVAGGDQSTPALGQARLSFWRIAGGLIVRY